MTRKNVSKKFLPHKVTRVAILACGGFLFCRSSPSYKNWWQSLAIWRILPQASAFFFWVLKVHRRFFFPSFLTVGCLLSAFDRAAVETRALVSSSLLFSSVLSSLCWLCEFLHFYTKLSSAIFFITSARKEKQKGQKKWQWCTFGYMAPSYDSPLHYHQFQAWTS